MKMFANRFFLLMISGMVFSLSATAQIEVRVRPAVPVAAARPLAPSPRHIWIDGGWAYRSNGYVWTNGYWMMPRPGMVWIPGSWRRTHRGYIWVPGKWRRRY